MKNLIPQQPLISEDDILDFGDLISETKSLKQLKEIYSIHGSHSHPYICYRFGLSFLSKGDRNLAKQSFIEGATYGLIYPCIFYETSDIDSIGQCFRFLATEFSCEDLEISTIAYELAYLYLSKAIELMPRTAFDSYNSRAELLDDHSFNYEIQSIIIENFGKGFSPDLITISDYYFSWKAPESPFEDNLEKAESLLDNLGGIKVNGKYADEYSLEEMALLGERKHLVMFKAIEHKYKGGELILGLEEIEMFED